MQFSQIVAALFAGAAVTMAAPADVVGRNNPVPVALCPSGLYNIPQCCATDVLGVADLDCATPTKAAGSSVEFSSVCAETGKTARCCSIPALGQGVLCTAPLP